MNPTICTHWRRRCCSEAVISSVVRFLRRQNRGWKRHTLCGKEKHDFTFPYRSSLMTRIFLDPRTYADPSRRPGSMNPFTPDAILLEMGFGTSKSEEAKHSTRHLSRVCWGSPMNNAAASIQHRNHPFWYSFALPGLLRERGTVRFGSACHCGKQVPLPSKAVQKLIQRFTKVRMLHG